ncbi:MAG: hypothetical protein MRJ66_09655 [Nitrospira sp.]|nr:hypothetical protein [Nitrospira sp.]
MSSLPNEMISPSPMDLNLSNLSGLADHILNLTNSKGAAREAGRAARSVVPRRITVLLPDSTVRTTVLHFEQLPTQREERENLIRWRLGQEQLFSLNGAKIVFQVFRDHARGLSGGYTVLTSAIQDSVLQQYESLCESVGLIPYDVGMTSLKLLNLWKRVSDQSQWSRRTILWVNLFDRALTIIVCQRGFPLFYRCKLLGEDVSDLRSKPELLQRVLEECSASLEVCHQRHPSLTVDQAVICAEGEVSTFQEQMEDELQLSAEQLHWKSVETLGWVEKDNHRAMTSLAALAGLP